jgi:ubiquinone/menaquinone biosynthesis C-methylase UbiE
VSVPEKGLAPPVVESGRDSSMTISTKSQIAQYWNRQSCGTGVTSEVKHTRAYFEEIEQYRYRIEPEIFAFAQFTRHHGERLLEVGIGAGSDFLQWVRAGTMAHGFDLTEEAVDHVRQRLAVYGLHAVVTRADAEAMPYADAAFDIIYSWGVIHHSPDMERAFAEIVRCTVPGGIIKLMVYNRRSLHAFYAWVRHALLRGRPLRSFSDVLFHHMESIGTKAYTRAEIEAMAERHGLEIRRLDTTVSQYYDLLAGRGLLAHCGGYLLAAIFGYHRCGWFLRAEMMKPAAAA